MTDPRPYPQEVRRKAERMARGRRTRSSPWLALAHAGALGWVLILPAVLGVALGRLLERATGRGGLTVLLLLVGLALGAALVARQVRRALQEEEPGRGPA